MKLSVIFEDEDLLAVNKPAGLPVHKTYDDLRPNLQSLVEKQVGKSLVLFHRLDLETTGVILFGKTESVNRPLTEAFRDRQMQKIYWAVVDGRWDAQWSEVQSYIVKGAGGSWKNAGKGSGGVHALTRFVVLASNGDKTFLEVKPETGRTHQIRLHCLMQNHAILGDRRYGRAHPQAVPMALHARELSFAHPITAAPLKIVADTPTYWNEIWLKGLATR